MHSSFYPYNNKGKQIEKFCESSQLQVVKMPILPSYPQIYVYGLDMFCRITNNKKENRKN